MCSSAPDIYYIHIRSSRTTCFKVQLHFEAICPLCDKYWYEISETLPLQYNMALAQSTCESMKGNGL